MGRRLYFYIALLVVVAAIGLTRAQNSEGENPEWTQMEVFFFVDKDIFKVRIITVPEGRIIEEATEEVEYTLGDMGVAVAAGYPRTWLVMGPITRKSEPSPPSPYMKYCMNFFDLKYLGAVAVEAMETELFEPEPQSVFHSPVRLQETWGDDPESEDGEAGEDDIEDDFEEPVLHPAVEVDAYLHLWKFNGKKSEE